MNDFGFWQVAGLYPVIDEGFSKASIRHDEFQINKTIWLHIMSHKSHLQSNHARQRRQRAKESRYESGDKEFGAECASFHIYLRQ